jgi:hypothetical protein
MAYKIIFALGTIYKRAFCVSVLDAKFNNVFAVYTQTNTTVSEKHIIVMPLLFYAFADGIIKSFSERVNIGNPVRARRDEPLQKIQPSHPVFSFNCRH